MKLYLAIFDRMLSLNYSFSESFFITIEAMHTYTDRSCTECRVAFRAALLDRDPSLKATLNRIEDWDT